jgi:hypothetical protein
MSTDVTVVRGRRVRRIGAWTFCVGIVTAIAIAVALPTVGPHLAGSSLVDQVDARSTAPRYGVPHALYLIGFAGWVIALLVGLPVSIAGWMMARRAARETGQARTQNASAQPPPDAAGQRSGRQAPRVRRGLR